MNLINKLNYKLDEEASTDKHVINSPVRIGEAFTEVARIIFGTCTLNQDGVKNVKKNKMWFNNECKAARKS